MFSVHEAWALEAKMPGSDTCWQVITPLGALYLPSQWLPVSHTMSTSALEPLGMQVDSRVRLRYCLGRMQIQGLDSLEVLPTTMS